MGTIARRLFAAFFTGLVSAVFAISFAAIIYQDTLSPYLDHGIALSLIGAVILAFVGALTLSYRGTILAPQDVPAILLSGAAATFSAVGAVSSDALFATVACLVAVSSIATGVVSVFVGHLRLAYLARFVPYPVLAGFLAATGLLLVMGGLGVALGDQPADISWSGYMSPEMLLRWAPALVAGVAILIATQLFQSSITLPLALTGAAGAFYVMVWVLGMSMQEARDIGLLLGPFSEGNLLEDISPALIGQADWSLIATQVPVILTIIASCLIGATLNASGLELEFKKDFDISQDVKGTGIANILGGIFGAMPGYHIVGESILANRLGLKGSLAGISSGLGCLAILLFGATFLSVLPVGLFAAVLIFLGSDLLLTWVWQERRRLDTLDFAIVLMIPIIAVTFGFLTAIAVGLLVACALFVISYAKLNLIRSESSLSTRNSPVERPDNELQILASNGAAVQVVELAGYLFFGSANTLRDKMQPIIASTDPKAECLLLDFKHTTGIDISTCQVLARLAADCEDRNVQLVISGLSASSEPAVRDALQNHNVDFFESLNDALENVEDILIQHHASDHPMSGHDAPEIETLFEQMASKNIVERISLEHGEMLVQSGAQSDDVFYLYSGGLAVTMANRHGARIQVAKVRPKTVIGEMAYYSGKGRSADIIASAPSVVLRIDMTRFEDLERENPEIALSFHKTIASGMARRLNRTNKLVRDLTV